MEPTRQYLRQAELVVGKGGNGLLIRDLRIAFEITKTADGTPNEATIKIYNLNDSNQNRVRNEFEDVILNVGYKGSMAVVFKGNITRVFRYKEGLDWIVEIEAGDGDFDFRRAVMNESLEAGVPDSVLIDRALGTMSRTQKGPVKGVGTSGRMRGKVISGNTRNVLNDVSRQHSVTWSIQDGQMVIVPINGVLDDEAIVVNSDTGMLSSPEQGDQGIKVKTLLNPQYKIHGRIKLDNNNIRANREKIGEVKKSGDEVTKSKKDQNPVRLDPDGIYKIFKLIHKGDTFGGGEWTSELLTIGLGQSIPQKKGK